MTLNLPETGNLGLCAINPLKTKSEVTVAMSVGSLSVFFKVMDRDD